MVLTELDGSLDDRSYISTFPKRERVANQKVFPFSLSFAAMEINMMVHYLLALDWWPKLQQPAYQFTLGTVRATLGECRAGGEVQQRLALGDLAASHYLKEAEAPGEGPTESQLASGYREGLLGKLRRLVDRNKG